MTKNKGKQEANLFENTAFGTFETEGQNNQENEILKVEDVFGSQEQPNAFSNPIVENIFDSEPPEIDDEETDTNTQNEVVKTEPVNDNSSPIIQSSEVVTATLKKDSIEIFELQSKPLIEKVIKIISIGTDDDNANARTLAKELADLKKKVNAEKIARNKPLNAEIDANGEKAKKIVEPIDVQIERVKQLITNYELEKERKRKEEIAKIEAEKKEREEKERLNNERISKIRGEIQRLRELSSKSIGDANTLSDLLKIETNMTTWKPKQEYFMEFFDEVDVTLRNEIKSLIEARKPILKELDEQREKAAKLEEENKEAAERERKLIAEKLEAEKKKKEQEDAIKKAQEETEEMNAKNEITVLVASLGIKDFEPYIENILKKYGNYRTASASREKIITSFQEEQEEKRQKAILDAQRIKNQRVDYDFEITDVTKVPLQYWSVDESKIKKAIQENRSLLEKDVNSFKIDGVKITPVTTTVLKK